LKANLHISPSRFRATASKYLNYTKRKQGLRFLNSKPRRSLYRLRLKFVQTTRVVCTDYSWSLQKVLRTYENKYDVLTEVSTHTYNNKYVYSLKQVRALTEKRSLSDEHSNIFDGNTTATLLIGKPYEQLPIS